MLKAIIIISFVSLLQSGIIAKTTGNYFSNIPEYLVVINGNFQIKFLKELRRLLPLIK